MTSREEDLFAAATVDDSSIVGILILACSSGRGRAGTRSEMNREARI